MTTSTTTAVVMARGLGSRMQRENAGAILDDAQRGIASRGIKAMIPDANGRPFLDHILSAFADAGVIEVVLVVAPDHEMLRTYYAEHPPQRIELKWAIQTLPTGTADAVLAAENAVTGRSFIVCNADNLYPVDAIHALTQLESPGVVAFDRDSLIAESNIEASRIAAFAALSIDSDNFLAGIVEKPGTAAAVASSPWIGMNIWNFDAQIFDACREVAISERGERELPQAVALAISKGMKFWVVRSHQGVLDLSSRGDIAAVASRLAEAVPQP